MKKITFTAALFAAFTMNAQSVVFEDSFETYADFDITDFGDWSIIDVDQDPTFGSQDYDYTNESYTGVGIVFNPSLATPDPAGTQTENADQNDVFTARTGDKVMYFIAGNGTVSGASVNDDYFISPAINLSGASGGTTASFWARSLTDAFGLERFEVLLSNTGTEIADFSNNLTGGEVMAPIGDYVEFSYDISAFEGDTVYVAIHYVAQDSFILLMDDFSVTAGVLGLNDTIFEGFSYFLDAQNQLNLSAKTTLEHVTITNILGQQVLDQKLSTSSEAIDMNNFNTGMYIATVTIDGAKKSFKVIKK